MSEEKTHSFDADSTSPLPSEDFVRQHLALLLKAQAELREEMIERFVQLSQQNLRIEALIAKIREEIRDLDYKVGPFIKEQINLKRSLDEVRERVGLETY